MSWRSDDVPRVSATVSTFVPEDGSDVVLFDSATSQIHRLPGTSSFVWAAIDEDRTMQEIVDLVSDHFKADRSTIEVDIEFTLDWLRRIRAIA